MSLLIRSYLVPGSCATTHIQARDGGGFYVVNIHECIPSDSEFLAKLEDKPCKDVSYLVADKNRHLHSVQAEVCVCKEDKCNRCLAKKGDGGPEKCDDPCRGNGAGGRGASWGVAVVLGVVWGLLG